MMQLPINGTKLIALIPQRPPFVFISELLELSSSFCKTSFTVSDDCILSDNGIMNAGGLIENMAQTCAAKAGYEYTLINKVIPVGFIGDVRNFSCTQLPKVGEKIFTTIEIENEVFGVSIISGKVELNGNIIASCKMKIFVEQEKSECAEPQVKLENK